VAALFAAGEAAERAALAGLAEATGLFASADAADPPGVADDGAAADGSLDEACAWEVCGAGDDDAVAGSCDAIAGDAAGGASGVDVAADCVAVSVPDGRVNSHPAAASPTTTKSATKASGAFDAFGAGAGAAAAGPTTVDRVSR
jgi:hypothetical protein